MSLMPATTAPIQPQPERFSLYKLTAPFTHISCIDMGQGGTNMGPMGRFGVNNCLETASTTVPIGTLITSSGGWSPPGFIRGIFKGSRRDGPQSTIPIGQTEKIAGPTTLRELNNIAIALQQMSVMPVVGEEIKTTQTAGVGGKSNLLMYLLVAGVLYYVYSQGMFKKLLK